MPDPREKATIHARGRRTLRRRSEGKIPNRVTVPGYVPADEKDEAAIVRAALRATEYLLIDVTDAIGEKFLMVTAIPNSYCGFSFSAGNALPERVHTNIVVICAASNTKVLSTYPADSDYVAGRPGTRYTVA